MFFFDGCDGCDGCGVNFCEVVVSLISVVGGIVISFVLADESGLVGTLFKHECGEICVLVIIVDDEHKLTS